MRYYRKPPIGIVSVGVLVVFFRYFLQSRSFATSALQAVAGGILLALVAYAFHRCWYWEVGDTALIHRRLFRRIAFPFSEITYIGPMTGDGSGYTFFENTILVRTSDGKRMFIDTTDPGALLADTPYATNHIELVNRRLTTAPRRAAISDRVPAPRE